LLGKIRSVTGAGGLSKVSFDTVGSKNLARLIEKTAPGIAAVAGVGVVDQKSILDERVHMV
jgi:hypothetical protein